ncbi:MAG TPA: lipoprotein insertase outer membrane protein LolB [Candidimonas sp.]|nr:lipoprotein insertase outer membrane protein LolB [Candidimonas sp.]
MTQDWFARVRIWCCMVVAAVFLGACATPPPIAGDGGPAFDRSGRFALSVQYFNGKQEAVQGGFAWHDAGRSLELDLANPLGNTLARVQVVPGHAILTRSNGETEQAPHADALVEKVLGSPIPVEGLRDWLQGRTGADPVANLEKNSSGQPVSFSQNGWRVQLSRYDVLGPTLLQMNRNDANRSISVRLVTDRS